MSVVITGLGVCTPLGRGVDTNWRQLTNPSPQSVPSTIEAGLSGAIDLAQQSVDEALLQAGLWDGTSLTGVDPERVGCTLSASKPFLNDTEQPAPPERVMRSLQAQYGWRGESRNVIAACATGAYAIALGAAWIEEGLCDVVIAGSVEAALHPLIQAGFAQMGVFSTDGVTRPFDRERSGFVPGAGSGILILESAASARRRGAMSLAQLSGWGLGADGHSAVAFNSNGARIADVIARALQRAALSASEIRHVNAHGTGTKLNDWIETQALHKAFGRSADTLMISATKAGTGHLLGAAGSVEAVLTVLALRHQYIPPTATLQTPDPECALDYTPRTGHAAFFDHALSLSFGFGGPIGALVFSTSAKATVDKDRVGHSLMYSGGR